MQMLGAMQQWLSDLTNEAGRLPGLPDHILLPLIEAITSLVPSSPPWMWRPDSRIYLPDKAGQESYAFMMAPPQDNAQAVANVSDLWGPSPTLVSACMPDTDLRVFISLGLCGGWHVRLPHVAATW